MARARRRAWYLQRAHEIAQTKKDIRAVAWLASVTDPDFFSASATERLREQIELALDNVQREFSSEPEVYERVLTAIARGDV